MSNLIVPHSHRRAGAQAEAVMALRREQLPALTALRFFAALAVFVVHAWSGLAAGGTGTAPPMGSAAGHLATGVTFFFVLSGFILTYNYLDALRRPTVRGVWNFWVARWARIYPVHVLACLAMVPLTYQSLFRGVYGNPTALIAANLTLTQTFLPDHPLAPAAFNPPAWSLSAELFFYLLMPLLIPGLTTGSLARRCAVLLLALVPWLVAMAGLGGAFGAPRFLALTGRDPIFFPPVRLVDFLAGVLLGLAWHRWAGSLPARRSVWAATAAEAGAILVLAGWVWTCARYATTPAWDAAYHWGGLYLPPFALLVWVFARGGGLLARLLATRLLVYLGEISYSFYMLHFAVLIYAANKAGRHGFLQWPWGWKWIATALATAVLSAACYHLYELPLRDWLRRKLSFRRKEPAEVPAVAPAPEPPARRAA